MDEPIEEVYFNWLYSKVASVDVPTTPSLSYLKLLRLLHSIEFVWLVSGDDNRAEDGLEIRREFLNQSRMDYDPEWALLGCSVFEMLIAFARRTEWQTDISVRDWFWIFLTHLGLDSFCDAEEGFEGYVTEVIQQFIWRTYDRNGHGGLFPLHDTDNDQRKIEIWYQFCEYLVEQGM